MRTLVLVIACAIATTGCAVMDHKVVLDDLQQPSRPFVLDQTQPDGYPAFLAGEGNDLTQLLSPGRIGSSSAPDPHSRRKRSCTWKPLQ